MSAEGRSATPPDTPERCWCDGSAYRPHPAGTDACRTPKAGRVLSCAYGCVLPDDEQLFDLGGEKFHAVMTREGCAYRLEPPEYEPCGPVTSPARETTPDA